MTHTATDVQELLEAKYRQFNQASFIENDPISIPHQFTQVQDIEISGFFAATLAWGQRKTIIRKTNELMQRMDNSPYDFVCNHQEDDLKQLLGFKHRTFNELDLLYFVDALKMCYSQSASLEHFFLPSPKNASTEEGLNAFYNNFFSLEHAPLRTHKHLSKPAKHSACKRLNMYLRWMVRKDAQGVDFGIWKNIASHQLVMPLDVHVIRQANRLNLLHSTKTTWVQALELTHTLKQFDANDPVKYDFALFGIGIEESLKNAFLD